jgi:hypothetical protein
MLDRQDDTTAPSGSPRCTACARDFVVPVSVVDLLDADRCVVELACTNCGTAALGVHDDRTLMALDRHLEDTAARMRAAVDVLDLADELERIDAFAAALRDGHVLPEDF